MFTKRPIFLFVFFILCLVSSCAKGPEEIGDIRVESLREHFTLLTSESRQWKDDSYLNSVTFDFAARDGKVLAYFQSPSDDYESLQLIFDPKTNSISKKVFNQEVPILFHNQIAESDWHIDSVDAIEHFLSFDDVRLLWTEMPQRCNNLKLRHFFVDEKWTLAWVLTISDCQTRTEYFYLDPNSGERLNLKY